MISDEEVDRAMSNLLPESERTGDTEQDLLAAFREAIRRREQNTADGGAVVLAMRDRLGWSWTTFTVKTGVSNSTGRNWVKKVVSAEPVQP